MKSLASEDLVVLRNAKLNPEIADKSKGTQLMITPMRSFSLVGNNAYLGYKNIDLNEISHVELSAQAQTRVGASGGFVELRLDSPTGTLLGKSETIEPPAPAQQQPFRPSATVLKINVPANTGQHDVYFVFKNDKAKDSQIVMSLSAIEFKSTE
jgi:cytochrome c